LSSQLRVAEEKHASLFDTNAKLAKRSKTLTTATVSGQQSIIELEETIAANITMSTKLKALNEQLTMAQTKRRQTLDDQHHKTQQDQQAVLAAKDQEIASLEEHVTY
jgi:hypothetical protein